MKSEPRYAIQYVRLPERLKKRLDIYAKRQRVGRMNDHIILAVDEYLTKYDAAEPTPEPVAQ